MKLILKGVENKYDDVFAYQCFMCEPGCITCDDPSPCVLTLNWIMRSILLAVSILILCGTPLLVWFTVQYRDVKVTMELFVGSELTEKNFNP
jgi:G protein-coupled receptor 158